MSYYPNKRRRSQASHPHLYNQETITATGSWFGGEDFPTVTTPPQELITTNAPRTPQAPQHHQSLQQQDEQNVLGDRGGLSQPTYQLPTPQSLHQQFPNNPATQYATPPSISQLSPRATPFTPQQRTTPSFLPSNQQPSYDVVAVDHFTGRAIRGAAYPSFPPEPPPPGGDQWQPVSPWDLTQQAMRNASNDQYVMQDYTGNQNAMRPAVSTLNPIAPSAISMNNCWQAWSNQYAQYPTPPNTMPLVRRVAPASMDIINQTMGQYPIRRPTDQMLREVHNIEDPNRVVGRLQPNLELPGTPGNVAPQRPPPSQSRSQHSCNHTDPDNKSCDMSFDTPSKLRKHQQTHLPMEERPHKCDLCARSFLYEKDLTRHYNSKQHQQRAAQQPPEQQQQAAHHAAERQGRPRGIYECPVPACRRDFTRRDNYRRHLRSQHPQLGDVEPIMEWRTPAAARGGATPGSFGM